MAGPQQIGLSATLDMTSFNRGMSQYLGGIDKMNKETGSFAGAATAHFQSFGKSVLGATAVMGGALVAAAGAAGLAVGKFTVDGIKAAADLEAQLSEIAAVLGKTKDEVAPLNDLILKLGLDPNLKVTATEAADAIENLARNGLSMTQILDGAAHSTVLLANATGADFGTAADIATDVMAQFGKEATELNGVVNGIVATTNLSKMTIDDYRLAISQAGGVAASVGVSFEDFNTSIAATAPLFASGSDAGTSFKTFLTTLTPKSKDARKAMEALGLQFFDNNGAMKNGADIAEELNRVFLDEVTFTSHVSNATAEQVAQRKMLESQLKRTKMELFKYQIGINGVAQSEEDKIVSVDRLNRQYDAAMAAYQGLAGDLGTTVKITRELTEEEKIHYAQVIFGTDAMRTAFALAESGNVIYTDAALAAKELGVSQEAVNAVIEGGVTQFEALQLQMAQIDAQEQAATRMDNFKGKLEIVQGQIETLQITIGQQFLPVLTQLAEWAGDFVARHSPAIIAAFAAFAQNLSALINYLVLVVTDGDLMNDWLTHMSPALQAVVLSTIAWVGWIQQVVAAIQSFLEPITTAIASFVSWQDVLLVVGASIAYVVIPAVLSLLSPILATIAVVGGAILAVAALRTAWESDFLGIQTRTVSAIDYITGALEPFTSALSQHLSGALTEIKNWVLGNETEFTNVKAIWDGAKTAGQNLFGDLKNYLVTNLPVWIATLTEWGNAAWQWIVAAIPVVVQKLSEWWTLISGYVSVVWQLWKAQLLEWSNAAWSWVSDAIAQLPAKLAEWYAALSTYVTTNLPAWKAQLLEWSNAAWGWIVAAAGIAASKLADWWTIISGYVTVMWPLWKAKLLEWGNAIWQWIVDAVPIVAQKLTEWWTAITTYVAQQLPAWKQTLTLWGTAIWQWIIDAAGQVAAKLGVWFAQLVAFVAANLPNWIAILRNWATAAWNWIADAAEQVAPKLATWWSKLTSNLGTYLIAFAKQMLTWATALVEWISDKSANALPHLGTWLGKILAWATLGAIALAVKMVQFAISLVGWIAKAAVDIGPELLKFTGALLMGLVKMSVAIVKAMAAFAVAWWTTIRDAVDWNKLGQEILGKLKAGWDATVAVVTDAASQLATSIRTWFYSISWTTVGKNIITWIKDGIIAMASTLYTEVATMVNEVYKKFTAIDWKKVGTAIMQGIIDGLTSMMEALKRKAEEIANALPDWMKTVLGIDSPSKVFMEIGRNVVRGLIIGLEDMKDVKSVFTGLANSFKSFLKIAPDAEYAEFISQIESANQFLDAQIDLLDQLERSGLDPAKILGNTKLGLDADPKALASSIAGLLVSAQNQISEGLFRRQTGLIAKAVIKPMVDALSAQSDRLKSLIDSTIEEFGQLRIGRLMKQIDSLDAQIKTYTDSATPLNAGDQLRLASTIDQRALLINQIADVNRLENSLGIAQGKDNLALMQKQVDILEQAKELGVNISSDAFGGAGQDSTLRALTMTVAAIQQAQAAQLRKQIDMLRTGENSEMSRLDLLEEQRKKYDEQVALLKEMQELGINISGTLTTEALQQAAIQVAQAKLQNTLDDLRKLQASGASNKERKAHEKRIALLDEQTASMEQQIALLKKMQDFGINFTGPFTAESMQQAALRVSQAQFHQTSIALRQLQADSANNQIRKSQTEHLAAVEQRNAFIEEQITLLKEMQDLGLSTGGFFGEKATKEMMQQASLLVAQAKLSKSIAELQKLQAGSASAQLEKYQDDRLEKLNAQSDVLQQQVSLIDEMKKLGMSIPDFFGVGATAQQIQSALIQVAQSKIGTLINAISASKLKDLAERQLRPWMNWLQSQNATLDNELTKTVSEFGQLRIEKFLQQLKVIDQQIANYTSNPTPIGNALNEAQVKLSALLTQRANLISLIDNVSDMEDIFGISTERSSMDFMKKQIDLLELAKELGVSIPQDAYSNVADENTLRVLTVVLANIQHAQAWQLKKQLELLRNPQADPQAERLKTLEKQQASLDEQLTLLQRIKSLGMQLSGEYDFGLRMTTGDLRNLTIRANEVQLQRTLNELALLERLSPELLNPTATGSAAQLYKAQVLDPMLKTLRESVMLESERVALIEQYKQKAAELAKIEEKQKRLDFLKLQADLLSQIDNEFANAMEPGIIQGIRLGVNADINDLLALAGRLVDGLIWKVKRDLGIKSPSKVFMAIGQNVMAGFSKGISSMAAQPIDALRQTLRPLPYAMSSRALTMNMGGVTINNGMDEVMFEARVRQVVEGLI